MKKGEIFEKFYTRSNKAINIGNLFLRASSVVYHNLARQKAREQNRDIEIFDRK